MSEEQREHARAAAGGGGGEREGGGEVEEEEVYVVGEISVESGVFFGGCLYVRAPASKQRQVSYFPSRTR